MTESNDETQSVADPETTIKESNETKIVDERESSCNSDYDVDLKRNLQSRHLQMIAIGGAIGTGLWIASGGALAKAGPVGAIIAYAFVGIIVYSTVLSIGEMATFILIPGAFSAYATRFVDPSLGFAMGWLYWFAWAITYPLELVATGFILQYWSPDLSIGIPIAVFWVAITALNFFPVKCYGELEFWLSLMKVAACLGFFLFGTCVIFGVGDQGFIGLKTWTNPGAFASHIVEHQPLSSFLGVWSVMIQAGFSYRGTELVCVAAGEAANPRVSIPAAVKKTFLRIFFIYVVMIFFIGALVPYTNQDLLLGGGDAASSPLVIAIDLAGVPFLADIINAILLITVISAGNSSVYSASRILVGLAVDGSAPAFFKRTSKYGVPYVAVAFTSLFGLIGFINMGGGSATQVFETLILISGVAGLIVWSCISISHIGFQKALAAQGISRDDLPYKTRWQPYFAWYSLFWGVVIIFTQGFESFLPWDFTAFLSSYISIIFFIMIYVGHKLITKSKFIIAAEADLRTGCSDYDETDWDEALPTSYWEKLWAYIT